MRFIRLNILPILLVVGVGMVGGLKAAGVAIIAIVLITALF